MNAQTAGPSRQPDPSTPQMRRSTDQRSAAATPTLTHKTSMVSATDTFASATDGEGYYTDAADVSAYQTDDARSRFESVPHTINAHGMRDTGDVERVSRTSSSRTAQRDDTSIPLDQLSRSTPISPSSDQQRSQPIPNAASTPGTSNLDTSNKETGNRVEPGRSHRHLRHAAILGLLSLSAIWGTLAREGLVALNTYDGESVAPLVWAQAVGCLIMGLAIGNRDAIEARYPPAYVMITTGLCGSITTFSKWMLDVFRAFGDQEHFERGGLHNVMDALSQTAVTLGMALVSVGAGIKLARVVSVERAVGALQRRRSAREPELPSAEGADVNSGSTHKPRNSNPSQPRSTMLLDASMLSLGLLFWIASAILCALYAPFRHVTFSLVLAPPGTILRYYLSRYNTHPLSKRLSLPLGTLAVNLFATAIICAAFTASRAGSSPRTFAGGVTGCEALQGLQDGFCGCLSTVSTFAVELRTIKPRRKAVRYAVVSWVVGVVICVLLVGVPWWNVGMDGRCLGYTY
ncbi:Fluoride export protein 2 [Pseudozyma hubeiensis]|nr:Fluoride export protein 2 [Pseudozyma hubeiensis]